MYGIWDNPLPLAGSNSDSSFPNGGLLASPTRKGCDDDFGCWNADHQPPFKCWWIYTIHWYTLSIWGMCFCRFFLVDDVVFVCRVLRATTRQRGHGLFEDGEDQSPTSPPRRPYQGTMKPTIIPHIIYGLSLISLPIADPWDWYNIATCTMKINHWCR